MALSRISSAGIRVLSAMLSFAVISVTACSDGSRQPTALNDRTPSVSPSSPEHGPSDNITARLPVGSSTEEPVSETARPAETGHASAPQHIRETEPETQIGTQHIPETEPGTQIVAQPETDSEILERILSKPVPKARTDAEYSESGELPTALMYHLIMETPYNDYSALFVRPEDWDAQLTALTEAGCTFLFANDYRRTAGKSVIISFDDGYEDNYTTMFPILKAHGAKATVFLISDMIGAPGYLTEDQIREMAQSGLVYFGCHTASHCNLTTVSQGAVRKEYSRSVEAIEALTGQPCTALAYPAGKYNASVIEVSKEFFDYAYLARNTVPEGGITPMTIPRVYVSRGMSAATLAARFR